VLLSSENRTLKPQQIFLATLDDSRTAEVERYEALFARILVRFKDGQSGLRIATHTRPSHRLPLIVESRPAGGTRACHNPNRS
jgi:hypothetical protein